MTRMRSSRVRAAIAVAALACVALVLPAAAGAVSSSITEYKLTAGSGPGDMTVGQRWQYVVRRPGLRPGRLHHTPAR